MRNVWKFGTRWSDKGSVGTSIFREVFYPNGLIFATTRRCLDICEGDLFAVADGYSVIAIAEAITPGCCVTKLRKENYTPTASEYLQDSGIYGCRVKYYLLDEEDSFPYCKMGKFYHAGEDVSRKVNELYDKYRDDNKVVSTLPLLFNWANKELAQDSFLCWILQCAASTYNERQYSIERQFGFNFIKALLAKNDVELPDDETVETHVIKQCYNIDVACKVVFGSNRYGILIEDKVAADVYNDIESYKRRLASDERFKECVILTVIVRTGDEKEVFGSQYPYFLRRDFLALFGHDQRFGQSQILSDFHAHMQLVENHVSAWKRTSVVDWDWDAWKGFFSELQQRGNVKQRRWSMIAKRGREAFLCAFPAWDDSIWLGPFVLYWQIESDRRFLVLKVIEVYANFALVRDAFMAAIDVFIQSDDKWKQLNMHKPSKKGTGYSMSLEIVEPEDWYGAGTEVQDIAKIEEKITLANEFCSAFMCAVKDDSRSDFSQLKEIMAHASRKNNEKS